MGSWQTLGSRTWYKSNVLVESRTVIIEYEEDFNELKKYFDWLDENNMNFKWDFNRDPMQKMTFEFENEEDKVLFALRWA